MREGRQKTFPPTQLDVTARFLSTRWQYQITATYSLEQWKIPRNKVKWLELRTSNWNEKLRFWGKINRLIKCLRCRRLENQKKRGESIQEKLGVLTARGTGQTVMISTAHWYETRAFLILFTICSTLVQPFWNVMTRISEDIIQQI